MKNFGRITAFALSLLLLLGSLGSLPGNAAPSDDIRQALEELQEQEKINAEKLEELEALHGENLEQMEQLLAEKAVTEQQVALLHAQIENSNQQIRVCGLLIADKQEELEQARQEYDRLSEENKDRILAMEENGRLSYWSILFEAHSFGDFLDRLSMAQEIMDSDRQRLARLQEAAAKVEQASAELQEQKDALEQDRKTLEDAERSLEEKQEQADDLIRRLAQKGLEYDRYLDASERLQQELMDAIAQKEAELEEAEYQEWLANQKPPEPEIPVQPPVSPGGWVTPVNGYRLTSGFGMREHPIYHDWRMHNGVDMACPEGTPIYAARSGKVTVADFQEYGAGNYVSINHGDGFASIYMHMTHYIVAPGQYVEAGQVIGYVGSTGASKGNHLHFGISYNGKYINPMEYVG